jgi:hypothetical protein
MFKNGFWSPGVTKHNHDFLHMGPLKYGYRTLDSGDRTQRNQGPAKVSGYGSGNGFLYQEKPGDYVLFKTSMTATERAAKTAEGKRTAQAGLIHEAMNKRRRLNPSPLNSSPRTSSGSTSASSEPDDFVGPLEQPPVVQYTCPRYNEIRQYMFDNRAPGRLALDTMTILSEPQFFRYVRDCGGINLTGLEFRNFLGVADQRGELFM